MVHYKALENIIGDNKPEIYTQSSDIDERIAKTYGRNIVVGKNRKTSPVLVDVEVEAGIDLILHHLQAANVSVFNQRMFVLPS